MEKLNDMPYIPDLKGMGFTAPTDKMMLIIHHSIYMMSSTTNATVR